MVIAVVISVLFLRWIKQNEIKENRQDKNRCVWIIREVISKLTLLLGAGMTYRKAWRKIVNDYDSRIIDKGSVQFMKK
ncbi:MAG: hypothetical protein ACLU80_00385 [Dorea sp.]